MHKGTNARKNQIGLFPALQPKSDRNVSTTKQAVSTWNNRWSTSYRQKIIALACDIDIFSAILFSSLHNGHCKPMNHPHELKMMLQTITLSPYHIPIPWSSLRWIMCILPASYSTTLYSLISPNVHQSSQFSICIKLFFTDSCLFSLKTALAWI